MAFLLRLVHIIGASLSRYKSLNWSKLRSTLVGKLSGKPAQLIKGLNASNFVERMISLITDYRVSVPMVTVALLGAFDKPTEAMVVAQEAGDHTLTVYDGGIALPALSKADEKVNDYINAIVTLDNIRAEDRGFFSNFFAELFGSVNPWYDSPSEIVEKQSVVLGDTSGATVLRAVRQSEEKWERLASCLGRNKRVVAEFLTLANSLNSFDFEVASEF